MYNPIKKHTVILHVSVVRDEQLRTSLWAQRLNSFSPKSGETLRSNKQSEPAYSSFMKTLLRSSAADMTDGAQLTEESWIKERCPSPDSYCSLIKTKLGCMSIHLSSIKAFMYKLA